MKAYYEVFAYNRATCDYDIWLGTATVDAARAAGAKVGFLVGYHKAVPDGWAFKAPRR